MKRWMRLTAVALCLLLGACPALGEAIAPLPEAEMVEQFPAELELDLEPEADWAEVSAAEALVPADGTAPADSTAPADGTAPAEGEAPAEAPQTSEQPAAEATPEPEAPPTLSLNVPTLALGVGESFALVPALAPQPAEEPAFAFESSKTSVATVNAQGKVTGKKKGSATITVTGPDGLSASCAVTVYKAPGSVTMNVKTVNLGWDAAMGVGSEFQLSAKLPKNTSSRLTYSGYNSAVVGVDETGRLVARGIGSTKVTVKTFNKKKATVKVKVLPGPDALELDRTALSLAPGESFTIAATLPKKTAGTVCFDTDDPGVAVVDPETGAITAKALGQTIVSATSFNGVRAECAVSVLPKANSITLSAKKYTLGLGETLQLKPKLKRKDGQTPGGIPAYKSSKASVASVDADGLVTAVKKGTAKITVTVHGGAKVTCTITVVAAPTSLKILAKKPKLTFNAGTGKGNTTTLQLTLPKGSASNKIKYSGYDKTVVKVSSAGKITALGVGETEITATTFNGKTSSCVVRVLDSKAKRTVNIAHRGGAGYWPENTVEAFENAASTGATAVELDARTTKDGVQVIHHDDSFTAGGRRYYIAREKLETLQKAKPGLCTLEEAIEVIRESGLEMHLELKKTADPAACVKAVQEGDMLKRTVFISFEVPLLEKVRKLEPAARIGLVVNSTPSNVDAILTRLGAEAICQQQKYLTKANLKKWQNRGLLVGSWTLDEPGDIDRWLSLDVDLITSNYPRRVTAAME